MPVAGRVAAFAAAAAVAAVLVDVTVPGVVVPTFVAPTTGLVVAFDSAFATPAAAAYVVFAASFDSDTLREVVGTMVLGLSSSPPLATTLSSSFSTSFFSPNMVRKISLIVV